MKARKPILQFLKKYALKTGLVLVLLLFFYYQFGWRYIARSWPAHYPEAYEELDSLLAQTPSLDTRFLEVVKTLKPLHHQEYSRLFYDWKLLGIFSKSSFLRGPYGKLRGYGIEHYGNQIIYRPADFKLSPIHNSPSSWLTPKGLAFSFHICKEKQREQLLAFYFQRKTVSDPRNGLPFYGVDYAAEVIYDQPLAELEEKELIYIFTLFDPTYRPVFGQDRLEERYQMNLRCYEQKH